MNLNKSIGLAGGESDGEETTLFHCVNMKLASLGCPIANAENEEQFQELAWARFSHAKENDSLAPGRLCPADDRIQSFLNDYLAGEQVPKLPAKTLVLDRHGLARTLSLPVGKDEFLSDIVSSYRVKQGVLHNPKSDRRTTQGIFHVAEGGLPIPDDKVAAPRGVFAKMLGFALNPPGGLLRLPFTSAQEEQAECFVTLLLRPIVCPAVPPFTAEKTMEIRFFVPGNLVSNLDFVESIFGNAGDPYLAENDAGLDVEHWTGHTGCVILAPHLVTVTKKAVGLPHFDAATERQRRDRMCWKDEKDLYNDGSAFKLTCRDARGVMVTIIADNYFGYCKKEVKTQISFAANLFGSCEEEHAGGALVYPAYDLGEDFSGDLHVRRLGHSFAGMVEAYGDRMELRPEGHAVDRVHPDIVYVPESVRFDLHKQTVSWPTEQGRQSIKLLADKTYIRPSGYKVHMEKPPGGRAWRLIGTVAEGTLCHKPCTVSGGGKSEISKSISDAILQGPVFVTDFKKDFYQVENILQRSYGNQFKPEYRAEKDKRPILSSERSLGSVIKLLTPSPLEFTNEHNKWLEEIPQYIKELVFVVKRFYKPEWGSDWRSHFGVDVINGTPGNELKCDNRKLVANFLRVGYEKDGAWRTFGLRKDFHPAEKIAMEDDITASVVAPAAQLKDLPGGSSKLAVKFVQNCEYRLFQRPDDAVIRGYDRQTELDFTGPDNFFSNYEPLTPEEARELVEDSIGFDLFTEPMRKLIREVAETGKPAFFVSSAHPRVIGGKPSKNPRYLQTRPDLLDPASSYIAETGARLFRQISFRAPLYTPVDAILPGRRNNAPDFASGIRSLAVYNPIHYMELPELFMEFICSMTGKSPSTTGAGSEGALTKGPFNALPPVYDLNNALVSYLLTGHNGFVTAASSVGPHMRVDHDVSLLVPEIWCRMSVEERDPKFLIEHRYLERCVDFEHKGQKVLASRLGYRINLRFVNIFFGRVFNHPNVVFTDEMLAPEKQDLDIFADGMDNIVGTQKRVAENYFNDGGIDLACPPLRALLHIMAHGHYEGKDLNHPEIRKLFTLENMLSSGWYAERLRAKQKIDLKLWERHVKYLGAFLTHYDNEDGVKVEDRLAHAKAELERVRSDSYLQFLHGSLGAQPLG